MLDLYTMGERIRQAREDMGYTRDAYDYTIFHVLMEQCPNSYRDGLYRVMSAYVQSVSEALKKEGS